MAWLPLITVKYEGGYYSPDRDPRMPIRIYSDRTIQDDILENAEPKIKRKRLTRRQFRRARRAARKNRQEGRV